MRRPAAVPGNREIMIVSPTLTFVPERRGDSRGRDGAAEAVVMGRLPTASNAGALLVASASGCAGRAAEDGDVALGDVRRMALGSEAG